MCVRKITPDGTISTVAGNGIRGYSGDGGPATSAELFEPFGVAVNSTGNLYIADTFNNRIRKVTRDGTINSVVGTDAGLFDPDGVAIDAAGNLFIADTLNHRIRKVTPQGVVSTVAGTGTAGFGGDGGPATSAALDYPFSVAVDAAGNLYIADSANNRVRKVAANGTIGTVAGNGTPGYDGDGGQASSAGLGAPLGVAVDAAGNLYVSDSSNNRVRRVAPDGTISTVAGNGVQGYGGDGGQAARAELYNPFGVAVDGQGNLYLADQLNNRIRAVATPWVADLVASGSLADQTLAASLVPGASDLGKPGCVFYGAFVPPSETLYLFGANGWKPYASNAPVAFSTGGLAASHAVLIGNTDLSSLAGTTVYAAYGHGATPAACFSDMLATRQYLQVYTIH
jgi:sugar lactone lactonase YvrE